ncbi:MAG: quinolinate synthase [Planctomycetota bacterium]
MTTTPLWQPPLPPRYRQMTDADVEQAIHARKASLGSDVVVLGHHYQQDQVIQFADFTGDSFKLSQLAAEQVAASGGKYVVFCGVHFMAETADILTEDHVQVVLPDLGAGCSMADMAADDEVDEAWELIHELLDDAGSDATVVPICYMNSSAAIKAFCGRHGGAVCTSSNADKIIRWALAGGELNQDRLTAGPKGRADSDAHTQNIKILFIPDQHLGRNTAAALGYHPYADTTVYAPRDATPTTAEDVDRATFLLWKGHCSVHKLFRPEHVDQVREQIPGVHVITHPECEYEVCAKADSTGSTEVIINTLENAQPGDAFAIGTENHLVNRLCNRVKPRGVNARILSDCQCLCTTMFRIDTRHLLYVLDELAEGRVTNRIAVDPTVQEESLLALNRMLDITGKPALETPATAAATTH